MVRSAFVLAVMAAASVPAQAQRNAAARAAPDAEAGDIVVTARRGSAAPLPDAAEYYRRHCYEPMRRTGAAVLPAADPDWTPLDEAARARFGVADPAVAAYELVDRGSGHHLLVKAERLARPSGVIEHVCTLVVIGGTDQGSLPGRIAAVFKAPGTRRHVGERDGVARAAGWERWLWSGMPRRGSRSWRTVNAERRGPPGGTWIVVSDPRFYDEYDYIAGELKVGRVGDRPVSVLSFSHITRDAAKRR